MTAPITHRVRIAAALSLFALLAACGGGGSDGSDSTTTSTGTTGTGSTGTGSTGSGTTGTTTTAGNLGTTILATTYASGSSQAAAYAALNAARLAGGFGTLAQNTSLDEEAAAQATYVAANFAMSSGVGGLEWDVTQLNAVMPDGGEGAHEEVSTMPDFVGVTPADRATHFGYPSTDVAESAAGFYGPAGSGNGTDCVTQLLASPGHRELLLDPRFRDIGIGMTTLAQAFSTAEPTTYGQDCHIATAAQSFTYSTTGEATAPTGWVGIYPVDGSIVSSTGDTHGHGFAPSVAVDSSLTLTVTSFTITDSSGNVVTTTLNTDALTSSSFSNWAFATPNSALAAGTTYTVKFVGSAGGTAINQTWTFTTPAN